MYVDAEDLSEVALDRYGVVALPTFKVFKWGEEVPPAPASHPALNSHFEHQ